MPELSSDELDRLFHERETVLARQASLEERYRTIQLRQQELARENEDLRREIDDIASKYWTLKSLRQSVESQLRSSPDGLRRLLPDIDFGRSNGERPVKKASWSAPLALPSGIAPDLDTNTLKAYLPVGPQKGKRLRSSAMVFDVMATFSGVPISKRVFLHAFFEKFPEEILVRYWEQPGAALSAAFDRAIASGKIIKIDEDQYVVKAASANDRKAGTFSAEKRKGSGHRPRPGGEVL